MTVDEARAYFIDCNEKIISVAKDENIYNYETQQVEDVFMRRTFEANELAIKALEQNEVLGKIKEEIEQEYNRLNATRADETLELGECLGLKMSLKIIGKYSRRE